MVRRSLAYFILLVCAASVVNADHATTLIAQNIFDDEPTESAADKPKPARAKAKSSEDESDSKPVVKKKRKKGKRKKAKAQTEAAPRVESAEYSPEELSRQSYVWAPENTGVELVSEAPGIKPTRRAVTQKPAAATMQSEMPEPRVPTQGFKLPEIPLTQVLIVAGFVILFLIYRFRVGRQIKRKKY